MELTGELLQASCDKARRGVSILLQNSADVEDVLQEACIKAIRAADTFEGRSSFYTWFYRIAYNEALMLLRRAKPTVELGEDGFECWPSKRLNPEEIFVRKAGTQQLVDSVLLLSPKLRAEILGWSTASRDGSHDANTLKARRFRAKRELREILRAW